MLYTPDKDDEIVAAWAEECSGVGWTNRPVWVLVRKRDGIPRIFAIQSEEQSQQMLSLVNVSIAVSKDMLSATKILLRSQACKK